MATQIQSQDIANNAVTAPTLSTNAIYLADTQARNGGSNWAAGTINETTVTPLSTTVTIPAGGRVVEVTVYGCLGNLGDTNPVDVRIKAAGTTLKFIRNYDWANAGRTRYVEMSHTHTPSAGSLSYTVTVQSGGAGNPYFEVQADALQIFGLKVKVI